MRVLASGESWGFSFSAPHSPIFFFLFFWIAIAIAIAPPYGEICAERETEAENGLQSTGRKGRGRGRRREREREKDVCSALLLL